jgi:hypothetical protein
MFLVFLVFIVFVIVRVLHIRALVVWASMPSTVSPFSFLTLYPIRQTLIKLLRYAIVSTER